MAALAAADASPRELGWARRYARSPGLVPGARAYLAAQLGRVTPGTIEHDRYVAKWDALDYVMDAAVRCRDCGRALRSTRSKARRQGPECEAKERAKAVAS